MTKKQVRKPLKQEAMTAGPANGAMAAGTGDSANQHDVAALAYVLWQARGCPDGTPETDWYCAEQQLRGHNPRRMVD